jgi:hypothetical protein
MKPKKNPAAVRLGKLSAAKRTPEELSEIGRKGGLAGGAARAAKLTAEQRSASAKKAAAARWAKRK